MSTITIPKEKTQFLIQGIGQFMFLYPGQAQPSGDNKAYKIEVVVDPGPLDADKQRLLAGQPAQEEIVKACTLVAHTFDPSNWFSHIFGANGRIQKFEEKQRKAAGNAHAVGKYVLSFNAILTNKMLGFEHANLTDPAQRQKWQEALDSRAPGAFRFFNPAIPSDIAYMEQENLRLKATGHLPIPEADYHKKVVPIPIHEIWAGCHVAVAGHCYWSSFKGSGVKLGLALDRVLLMRQGERLVGESSPDALFAAFAPSAELAPPALPTPPAPPGVAPPPPAPPAPPTDGGLSGLIG